MFTTDLVNLYNKNIFKISLYIYICQDEKCRLMCNLSLSMDVTHVSTSIFQGLFNNIVFRSVALVTKKVMGNVRFLVFTRTRLSTALHPTLCIKKNYKNSFKGTEFLPQIMILQSLYLFNLMV